MKLCIFAGTFNPIHNAHILMAKYILNNFDFDKFLFIPAYIPPHKDYNKDMCTHRLNMVKLAIEDIPDCEVSDIEFLREGKSYTYLTISELYKKYKIDGKINFVIGTDAFKEIETWYESDKLKQLIDFIVFMREDENVNFNFLSERGYNYKFVNMDFVDISSTMIRNMVKNKKDFSKLVSPKVEDYIKYNGLYKD